MSFYRKRGAKWYYTIEIKANGERKRIERVGGRTKAEAEKARARAMVAYSETGAAERGLKMTYSELADEWLKSVEPQVKANTFRNYKGSLKAHILPAIGDCVISTIRPKELQGLLNRLSVSEKSASAPQPVAAVLSASFDYAVFCEYMRDTPMRGVKAPRSQRVPRKRRAFTPDEFDKLIAHYEEKRPEMLPLIWISYHTGARLGEALALTWSDVDLDAKTVTINKTLLQSGELQLSPKSATSVRTIAISSKLCRYLRQVHAKQSADKLKYGKYYADTDRICRREDGTPLTQSNTHSINVYLRTHFDAGLSIHSLRHTHATLLLEAGEDLELVSKRLGHASVSTTAKVYSHILEKRQKIEREILENIF